MTIIEMLKNKDINIRDISSYSIFSRGNEWKLKIWFRGETRKQRTKYISFEMTGPIEFKKNSIEQLEKQLKENEYTHMKLAELEELRSRVNNK